MGPSGNCFVVGAQGSFHLEAVQSSVRSVRLRAILDSQHENELVYDRFGMKWQLAETRSRWKKSWYGALVARARLNPLVELQFFWLKPQPYRLDELKAKFLQALDQTTSNSAGRLDTARLRARISEAQSFDELIEAHRSMTSSKDRPVATLQRSA